MTKLYPLIPLRDIVVFPNMIAPLIVGRKKSIQALEDAMGKKMNILLVTQQESSVDEPETSDLYGYGTLATVVQLIRLPNGTIKALVEGKSRAKIVAYITNDNFLQAEVEERADHAELSGNLVTYGKELRKLFSIFGANDKKISTETVNLVKTIKDPLKILNIICACLPLKSREKQSILEVEPPLDRMALVLEILQREIELAEYEKKIDVKVKMRMGKTQKDYFLAEKIREIQKEIGKDSDGLDEIDELEKLIEDKKLPLLAKEKTLKEFKKLKNMPPMSVEVTMVRNYIDCIISLPWSKKGKTTINIKRAEKILDKDHYGLVKPKERILEYLAVQARVKRIKGPILCLVGPPGVGKTSICKSIASAMGRKFTRLSLGGVRDEAEIRGHRRTYVGAMPGKIIKSMQKAGVANPVFCLDEVDKMSMDFRSDPSSALLEALDPEQNVAFNDHYLDIDYDLSEIFFITTANNLHSIPVPLQDRMEIIQISGYTEEDKLQIAKDYLIPKQLKQNGFKVDDIQFTDGAVFEIVRCYTREAGVRNLERLIASICRKITREQLKKGLKNKNDRVTAQSVSKYLGTAKYRYGLVEANNEIGLTTGLAWTEMGGELLQIEASLMAGSGKLIITGKLGDVMQESAQAALSYVRSRARLLGLADDFYQRIDIHIHVPEGAISKDGPSAGITIATTLVSALIKAPVKHDMAMTGEITLRGRVLPIGGLTEKLLAAKRGNITHVLIPRDNERNLRDIPAKIKKSLKIDTVDHMDEVLNHAIMIDGGRSFFENH